MATTYLHWGRRILGGMKHVGFSGGDPSPSYVKKELIIPGLVKRGRSGGAQEKYSEIYTGANSHANSHVLIHMWLEGFEREEI